MILEIGALMKVANLYMNMENAHKLMKVFLLRSVANYIEHVFYSFGLEYGTQ